MGVRNVYNSDRPEAHDILKHWRTIAGSYEPERLLIGETNVETLERLAQFYGTGRDELHGGFNFQFMLAPFEAAALRAVVEGTEALLPEGAWPTWHGSNHDFSRLSTRWGGGNPAKVKLALLMMLTLRGTPFLYQGDEIGQVDGELEKEELLDPVGIRFFPYAGRDPERTPMAWHGGPGGGFSEPGVRPWLPMADPAACNVADQEGDPTSVLEFCRHVIATRRTSDDLAVGSYRSLPSPEGTWAYRRGARAPRCCSTCPTSAATFDGVRGRITADHRGRPRGRGRSRARLTLAPVERRRRRDVSTAAGGGGSPATVRRRYVLCTTPAQGHTAPLLALARRLVDEGHDVVFFTTAHYRDKVAATGASFVPFAEEYDAHDLMVANPERESSSKRGVRGVKDDLRRIFIGPIPGQCRDLRTILEEQPTDGIVVDSMFLGAMPLALGPRQARPLLACVGVMPYAACSRDTAPFGVALQPGKGPLARARNRFMNWATEHGALADIQRFARHRLAEAGVATAGGSRATSSTSSPRWSTPTCRRPWRASSTRARTWPRRCASSARSSRRPPRSSKSRRGGASSTSGRPVVHVTQGTLDNADLGRLLLLTTPRPGPRRPVGRGDHRRARPRAAYGPACRPTCASSASSPTTACSPTSTSW